MPGTGRGSVLQRLRATGVAGASRIVCRLPEGLAVRAAEGIGELWYRLTPGRAAQGRQNLRRVCAYLDATGRADARVRDAATDPRALERLVRAAYRHAARYYLEVARIPAMTSRSISEQVMVETPDVVDAALEGGRPVIFVGLHFGAIELPGLWLAQRTGRRTTAPMETIGDPALQAWFVRTRGRVGVRIVGLREARRELMAALGRGETVGLVADRDISGGGLTVPLFGAPAALPVGPALLAIESGAPIYVASVRRDRVGRYLGRLAQVPVPAEGSRRDRATAVVTESARAFEDVIALAPEQWWAVFFPIWPDLASTGTQAAR
jgi:phosphatidylinositol dimannoside acyltransferase